MKADRERNLGWFRRGPDPRRHQLTTEERRRGGRSAWLRNDRAWAQGFFRVFEDDAQAVKPEHDRD